MSYESFYENLLFKARRERAEAAAQLMEQNEDVEEAVDRYDDNENEKVEFYDVCQNYQK